MPVTRFRKPLSNIEPLESRYAPAATVLAIARALDLPEGISVSVTGDPSAVAVQTLGTTGQLLGFPSGSDGDFLILSTGIATHVTTLTNTGDAQGTDLGPVGADGDEVRVMFTLPVPVVTGPQRLKLDFMFLSEEFPEFVGAGFNDTFEVFINGENYAKDELGNLIEVNNTFFAGAPAPGTFFDGRTSKLTLNYVIPDGVTSLEVELRLRDVGDGVLDSAVLVDNVRFESPQVVFLDFDGASLVDHFGAGIAALVPAFSAADIGSVDTTENVIAQLLAQVQALYAAYDVVFTTTQPLAGDYTTIVIGGDNDLLLDLTSASPLVQQANGGTSATVRDFFDLGGSSLLGLADAPDVGNLNRNDQAIVFSGEFDFFFSGETIEARLAHLAVTIAHELGHNLGLRHVDNANFNDVMRLAAPRDTGAIFGTTLMQLAETWSDGVTNQNDHAYLTSILGKGGDTSVSPALAQNSASFSTTGGKTLYDVTITIQSASGSDAPLILQFATFDATKNLSLPSLPADATFTLTASSTPGGPMDVFSGKATGGALTSQASAVPLFNQDGSLASIPLSKSKGGAFSGFGALPLKTNDLGAVTLAPGGIIKLTDADGDRYTIRLKGPGVFGYVLDDADNDGRGGLLRLVLDDTTLASQLVVTVKRAVGGDGFVNIGEITGTAGSALKLLDARKTSLDGGGIAFSGAVANIRIHDLADGTNIFTGTASGVLTQVRAHFIGDGSNIAIGTSLSLFKAASFGASSFTAPSVAAFQLAGDVKIGVTGDFSGSVDVLGVLGSFTAYDLHGGSKIKAGGLFFDSTTLKLHQIHDGAAINLGSAVSLLTAARIGDATLHADAFRQIIVRGDKAAGIAGDVAGDITATNAFLSIRANDLLPTASVTANGIWRQTGTWLVHQIHDGVSISVESSIASFTAAEVGAASIHAAMITSLSITGNAVAALAGNFSATLDLSGGDVFVDNILGTATIAGALNGAKLTLDSIGSLVARGMVNSAIYAGFTPADAAAPLAGGVFFEGGLIRSLTIKGSIDAIANSIIAGTVVKNVSFGSVAADNAGIPFGIVSSGPLSKLKVPGFDYAKNGPADQALGDFHIVRL